MARATGHLQVSVSASGQRRYVALWRDADGRHKTLLGPAHVKDSDRRTPRGARIWRHRGGRDGGHHSHGLVHGYDRVQQAARLETDRPHAVREAIMSCANGGTVAITGVYGGFMDKFPSAR